MFSIQNSRVWSGLRGLLDLPPGPKDSANIDPSVVSCTYDISQDGWAEIDHFGVSIFNSINGAAYVFLLSQTTAGVVNTTGTRPTIDDNRRIQGVYFSVEGGTVNPIRCQISMVNTAGNLFTVWGADVANPGVGFFPLTGLIIPPGLDLHVQVGAGGAGDAVTIFVTTLRQVPGGAIPL